MKLGSKVTIQVGDDGVVYLNEPDAETWNTFQGKLVQITRGGKLEVSNNTSAARAWLFDQVFAGCENLENEEGPIESAEGFPARIKAEICLRSFESGDEISVKN